jgi:hypothetical protein
MNVRRIQGLQVLLIGLAAAVPACASSEPPPPRRSPVLTSSSSPADGPTFYRPYRETSSNFLYNLLFCDDPALFRGNDQAPPTGALAVLLSSNPRSEDLARIASDEQQESRVRILAFNALRSRRVTVPRGRVLGVVVEVPVGGGLDTLAAFSDGRMRYINHSEKVAIFETTPASIEPSRQRLMQTAATAAAHIGPWDHPRLPPPAEGRVRLTFLVSDGLYFGEGPFSAIQQDPVGGPVLMAAADLLKKIVTAAVPGTQSNL